MIGIPMVDKMLPKRPSLEEIKGIEKGTVLGWPENDVEVTAVRRYSRAIDIYLRKGDKWAHRFTYPSTDDAFDQAITWATRDLKSDRMRAYLERIAKQRYDREEKLKAERLARAKYVGYHFETDYADEFYVRFSGVLTGEEWKGFVDSIPEERELEEYFGTNEELHWADKEALLECFDVYPIPKYAYAGFRKAMGKGEVGMSLNLDFSDE